MRDELKPLRVERKNLMRKSFPLIPHLSSLIMLSCAPAVTLPTVVKIPVPVQCPQPPPVTRPRLAIASLPDKPTPDQYVRAVESSLEALMGYAAELETILEGYSRAR